MQELLSKTPNPDTVLENQEYYELRLEESNNSQLGYIVKQSHCQWSQIDGQMMWDDYEEERCSSLRVAEKAYEARRLALVQKGFLYSDTDFF